MYRIISKCCTKYYNVLQRITKYYTISQYITYCYIMFSNKYIPIYYKHITKCCTIFIYIAHLATLLDDTSDSGLHIPMDPMRFDAFSRARCRIRLSCHMAPTTPKMK